MTLGNVTRSEAPQDSANLLRKRTSKIRNGLRDRRSRWRRGARSDEMLVNVAVMRGAGPGIELGWEAGIRTPIPWSRGDAGDVDGFGLSRFYQGNRTIVGSSPVGGGPFVRNLSSFRQELRARFLVAQLDTGGQMAHDIRPGGWHGDNRNCSPSQRRRSDK